MHMHMQKRTLTSEAGESSLHKAKRCRLPEQPWKSSLICSINCICTAQDNAHERQKVMEAEAAQLRQALTSRAAEGSPTEAERCRQAEQLLAQQVRPEPHCSLQPSPGDVGDLCQYCHHVEVSIAAMGELLSSAPHVAIGRCMRL